MAQNQDNLSQKKQAQEDEQARMMREKRELLKLKQGIVEESEILEVDKPQEKIELHGMKRVENFFYHYKWRVVGITLAVVFVGIMIFQSVTKERNDLYVLAVSTENVSGIMAKHNDIEEALEQYCPDYDNNGYVHVGVNCINLSVENGVSEFTDAQKIKFTSEIATGDAQLFVADEGIIEVIEEMSDGGIQFFNDFSEAYPDASLYEGQGLQANTTKFVELARWDSCPDTIGIYVRCEYEDMTGNGKGQQEQRRRAMEVFTNIITGNIINPAVETAE